MVYCEQCPKEHAAFELGTAYDGRENYFGGRENYLERFEKEKEKKSVFSERMTVKNSTLLLVYKQIFPVFGFKQICNEW